MRIEKDFLGEVSIPADALYGINSRRARQNFTNSVTFPIEWYKATGLVKLACYRTVRKMLKALKKEHPDSQKRGFERDLKEEKEGEEEKEGGIHSRS